MGTRADFYIGRGESAEWLGSIAWDGDPDGIDDEVLKAKTVDEYARALREFFTDRDDVSGPDHGWPWPWNDSRTTDFAYALDEGAVWASSFGYPWQRASEYDYDRDSEDSDRPAVFPDMSAFKNTTYGQRSGVMLIGLPASEESL